MDFKRLMAFFAISVAIFAGWEHFFPSPKPNPAQQAAQQQTAATPAKAAAEAALAPASPITVTTDTVKAVIDEKSGDLRQLTLLQYKATGDEHKPFVLFNDGKEYTYVAQSELLDAQGNNVLKGISFTAPQKQYSLEGDKVEVRLSAPETNGLKIDKVYTFTKGSYLVNVRFDITNSKGQPVNLSADYRIVRDHSEPEGQGYFTRSYVGPVVYTPEGGFQKVSFSDLDDDAKSGKSEAEYIRKTPTGWLGMIEHHFMSTWILQPKDGQSICTAGDCRIDIKRRNDNLYSTSVSVPLAAIQNGAKSEASINLYAGPQTTSVIANIADNLQLAKDYGKVHWFASPLFWLLNPLHNIIGNWGWSQISEVSGNTVKAEDVHFMPIYVGVSGEDKSNIAIGTENYLTINSQAAEGDQKATKDFLTWLFTDAEGSKMAAELHDERTARESSQRTIDEHAHDAHARLHERLDRLQEKVDKWEERS